MPHDALAPYLWSGSVSWCLTGGYKLELLTTVFDVA